MLNGYLGKLLVVDLSIRKVQVEELPEYLLHDFIGGSGLGARLFLERMQPKTDPLGPDNILGFFSGPLTGTKAPFGNRFMVAARSPLTKTWGDANCGGDFGPYLKFAGYDAILIRGIASEPVYLFVDNGGASLNSAPHLWGKDTLETERVLRTEHGERSRVACIGPSGERVSLISSIITGYGRAAGRSGLGAVMGSKKLKAVVVRGKPDIAVADSTRVIELARKYIATLSFGAELFREYGTCNQTANSIKSGDAPIKNWDGSSADFLNSSDIAGSAVVVQESRKYGCWRCPLRCGGLMQEGIGQYNWEAGIHKPEYQTVASFGPLCLNHKLSSIIKCNDICNRYGVDTISCGGTIAFAIECYENGIISQGDADGLELKWGNDKAIVDLTLKIARRDGFGDLLADGVKRAAELIGSGSENFAMHIQGQEVPMHDPKRWSGFGTLYQTEATPGRHTQGHEGWVPPQFPMPPFNLRTCEGRGAAHKAARTMIHGINAAGGCLFGYNFMNARALPEILTAVTGWSYDLKELLLVGERIACARQLFNVREGLNPIEFSVPERVTGKNPDSGEQNITKSLAREFYKAMEWDLKTGIPSSKKLNELGMGAFIKS